MQLCSYMRRSTRNGAPTYSSSPTRSNHVEIYLDSAGSDSRWVIELNGRKVYRMPPNPTDPDYCSSPSFDACWEDMQGAWLCPLQRSRLIIAA